MPSEAEDFSQTLARSSGLDVLDDFLSISPDGRQNNNSLSARMSDVDIYDETLLGSFVHKISSLIRKLSVAKYPLVTGIGNS